MGYTIQSGDNLWNVAKKQYGESLKSNADIQKAVDAIVQKNNLKNPDLLFADDNLELPEIDLIFNNSNAAKAPESENEVKNDESDIFTRLNEWQDEHANLMAQSGDWSEYLEKREDIGASFDFMEGKDVNNAQEYDKQTLKLGKGDVQVKDSNNDDEVDFNEYFAQEVQSIVPEYKEMIANGTMSEDEVVQNLKEVYLNANKVFNIIDSAMGNGDNALDEKEFQNYYQHLDEYTADKNSETLKDGKIDIDFVTEYPEFLAQQVLTDEKTDKTAEKIVRNLLSLD